MAIKQIFKEIYEKVPESYYWSPGRVNIIGEHSDYHDGYVMPAAIDLGIKWAAKPREDGKIRVYSEKFDEICEFNISDKKRTSCEWALYLQGVVEMLKKRKVKFSGVDLAFDSTIPIGSGLSSSSSLATGFAYILNDLNDLGLDGKGVAVLACEAEWWYGTTGGIMDQYCIANGQKGYAVLLDARKLEHELVKIPRSIEMVVFETTIRHKQVNSPFSERRKQAEEVIRIIQSKYRKKNIKKLRDVSDEMLYGSRKQILKKYGNRKGALLFDRALHPITENKRVVRMKEALINRDYKAMGDIMSQSHQSLRNNYEVSCRELDTAVEIAHSFGELIGARMIGGGFGGCTLNLVRRGNSQHFAGLLEEKFRKRTGIKGNSYICVSSNGAMKIKGKNGRM